MIGVNMSNYEAIQLVHDQLDSNGGLKHDDVREILRRFYAVAETQDFESDLADANDEVDDLKSEVNELEVHVDSLESSIRKMSAELSMADNTANQLVLRISKAMTDYEERKL